MYGRLSKSVYGSLICDPRHLSSAVWRWRSSFLHVSRCQSTAARQQSEDRVPAETVEIENHPASIRSSKSSRSRYRHWQPHASAELGVESLGEPAEVLILPTRERKSLQINAQAAKSDNADPQSVIESDAFPLSWDTIKQNILAARDSMVELNVKDIELGKWTELKTLVSGGFTKQQLRKYIQECLNPAQVLEHVRDSASKKDLAEQIMKHVWALDIATKQPENAGQLVDDAGIGQKVQVMKTILVSNVALDLALQQEGRQLRRICDTFGVQIDVFREKFRLNVTGDLTSVLKARKRLAHLLKQPQHAVIALSDDAQALAQNPQFGKYLKYLSNKYNLRIVRKGGNLSVYAFNTTSIDFLRQDMASIALHDRRNANHSLLGGRQRLLELAKAKIYPVDLRHWFLEQQAWFRYVSRQPDNVPGLSDQGQIAGNARQKLDRGELPSIEDMSNILVLRRKDIKSEYCARLGYALFNAEKSVPSALQSAFSSDVPIVPQLLGKISKDAPILARKQLMLIHLVPCGNSMRLPCLNIYMSGSAISQGLKQQLIITKVEVSFGSAIHDFLLPEKQVDIRLERTRVLELFNLSGETPLPEHLPLLKSLSRIVQEIQSRGGSDEEQKHSHNLHSPIHEVDLTPLLAEAAEMKSTTTTSVSRPIKKYSALSLPEEAIKILTAIGKQTSPPIGTTYAVETPRWLDIAQYAHPSDPGLIIEHTLSNAMTDTNQHRHDGGRHNENSDLDNHYSQFITIKAARPPKYAANQSSPENSQSNSTVGKIETKSDSPAAAAAAAAAAAGEARVEKEGKATANIGNNGLNCKNDATNSDNDSDSDAFERIFSAAMHLTDLMTSIARRGDV